MPENLNDTAATIDQNTQYVMDRAHPSGKPYSRKQRDAIAAAKGKTMLYNGENPTNGVIFEGFEVADALTDGWVDAPLIHPNCPEKVAKVEVVEQDNELALLWAEVDRLGVEPRPHHRSGKDKLMKAITDYG